MSGAPRRRGGDLHPRTRPRQPGWFAICVATTDGYVYEVGDSARPFTIQSISKPFVYGLALEDNGRDALLTKVGVEPSGDAVNAISLDTANGRPLNPMINAGAIATTGVRPLEVDVGVYESESRTGHRDRAIGHLLRNLDVLTDHGLARGLTAAQAERLAAIMKPALVRRGDRLVTAGDEAASIILLVRGLASAWIPVPGGRDRRLATLTAGAMVGEMAFAEESPRSATAIAESDVECLVLQRSDFDSLRATAPGIHAVVWRNIAYAIADKLRKAKHDLGVYDHVPTGRG